MAEDEGKKEKGGMGRMILIPVGGLIVFLLAIPFFLFMNGMLGLESPRLRPAEAYVEADSVLTAYRLALEEAANAPAADASQAVQPASAAAGMNGPAEPLENAAVPPVAGNESRAAPPAEMGPPLPDSLRARVDRLESAAEGASDSVVELQPEKMARLVRVYEKMRPKQVALILGTMAERQAAGILRDMKDQSAAKVLAEMEPNKAARMSQLLLRTDRNGI